jgi:hypothetical protein
MTYMCICISLTNATACKYDIPIDTVSTQSAVIRELRVYPAEGPMSRASEAPFAVIRELRGYPAEGPMPTPVQGSQADEGSGGTCSPIALCAQSNEMGKTKERLICVLSEAKGRLD